MCIDSEGEILYVFGGRTVNGDTNIQNYSGLYSYNIKLNHWKLVRYIQLMGFFFKKKIQYRYLNIFL